ncbi:putative bifunctional diguanylate cyclase/phosphodiesterase [Wenxinia marina]|uniref:Diguanylate cyclase/phosphodiesterase n=1 Tax=Wenxinia marina DSM 24838 TaxID=1123501 RepID=A0A0D0Q3Y8_9RHOB|nr:GGDEF domain-containing phosphodiesterase [Wenxinia marina]KIQ69204.1 diguanylate cyclase/phosphodiesterase [Wenxinia marina DSM 24838]
MSHQHGHAGAAALWRSLLGRIGGRRALALPALGLLGLLAGGAVGAAVALLSAAVVLLGFGSGSARSAIARPPLTGRAALLRALGGALASPPPIAPVAMVIEIDRYRTLAERFDHRVLSDLGERVLGRLSEVLRAGDVIQPLTAQSFGLVVRGSDRLDLAAVMQLAGRLQRQLSDPFEVGGARIRLSASIGFAMAVRLPRADPDAMLQAASLAALDAHRNGPSAIRSYSAALKERADSVNALADQVADALERGEFVAYFQPQVEAGTGRLTGVEALARWQHPDRGLVSPAEFLPALQIAGRMDSLGALMVRDALAALRRWDGLGYAVPRVAVNFSGDELSDPRLIDRIGWELDRFELAPDRLVVEVLETVVANGSEDVVIRNLAGLARLGCRLDLDDFGTGHAAITSIRRFAIERIKIDRSFVTGIDADPEQQKMVQAILTMADRLGLDTLAEGVETAGEQKMLAELGCGHLQGYGIARPMPMDELETWIRGRLEGAPPPIRFQRPTG